MTMNSTGLTHVRAGGGDAVWVAGDTYTVKVSGDALTLIEASIPPGCGPPPHRHTREDEALYVLAGSLEISAEQERVHAGAGDFIHLPRGTLHSFVNLGLDAARALILTMPGGFEKFFQEIGSPARPGVQAPAPTAADFERALAVAPRYGVQIAAPAPAPQASP
jgi:quercetin dioxygenase-like cupin family protein